jgi:hypothetical protein
MEADVNEHAVALNVPASRVTPASTLRSFWLRVAVDFRRLRSPARFEVAQAQLTTT